MPLNGTTITLAEVKDQFMHWRATRTKLEKVPESLWEGVRIPMKIVIDSAPKLLVITTKVAALIGDIEQKIKMT